MYSNPKDAGWHHMKPKVGTYCEKVIQALIMLDNVELLRRGKYCSFSFMRRDMIENLPEPFRTGFETSKLWYEEKQRGGLAITNGLTMHLPETPNEDALFVLRLGYHQGFEICDLFGLGEQDVLVFDKEPSTEASLRFS